MPVRSATAESFADSSLQHRELAFENRSPQASTAVATVLCVSGVCHAESRPCKRTNEKGLWRGGRDSNRQLRLQWFENIEIQSARPCLRPDPAGARNRLTS